MQEVDFKKYADIVVNLQLHNEYYWLIKHFDDDMLDHIRERFDQESGMDFMERFSGCLQPGIGVSESKAFAGGRTGTVSGSGVLGYGDGIYRRRYEYASKAHGIWQPDNAAGRGE